MSAGVAVFTTLFMLLFFAVGILILVLGVRQIRHGRAAPGWPTTDAQLEQCAVRQGRSSGSTAWYVALKYTYGVAGVRYSGTTLAVGAYGSSNRKRHEKDLRRVLAMERFIIRYNPDDPAMSAVFLSTTGQIFWVFGLGVFWLTGTTCFTLMLLAMTGAWDAIGRWFA